MTLTDEEVRARFSAYREGDLPDDEREAVRGVLDRSAALSDEYAKFCELLERLAGTGGEKPVDLLGGVQSRLHRRSAGRFYRTAAARKVGIVPIEIFVLVLLAVMVLAYVGMNHVAGLAPAQGPVDARAAGGGSR